MTLTEIPLGLQLDYNLAASNPFAMYATDNTNDWTVKIETANYTALNSATYTMRGLAHVYCDFNF
jgi:hypothetical protein